ncbi:MAG: DnaB-like helicase C-terminal domain-containing protein [Promethearchaeia archaeon]
MEQLKNALDDDDVVHISEATIRDGEYTQPYPIGYDILDDAIKGGVREGDLIIGTGLSGMGKTTFFSNISVNLSNIGNSCIWFSYEMIIDNFYAGFKEMNCDCENLKLYTPKQMSNGNLEWIQTKIKEGLEKYNTKFVFIDHIDFLAPKNKVKSSEQKRMVIRDICMELKTLAIELKVVIFLISHVKKVQGRAIEMQDLTESGAIYQLADMVLVVERYVEITNIGGKKTEIITNESAIRFLKNRITGQLPKMNFHLENKIIIPDYPMYPKEKEQEQEIIVEENEEIKKKVGLFGDKT